jgi:hypothetical protein
MNCRIKRIKHPMERSINSGPSGEQIIAGGCNCSFTSQTSEYP